MFTICNCRQYSLKPKQLHRSILIAATVTIQSTDKGSFKCNYPGPNVRLNPNYVQRYKETIGSNTEVSC